MMVKHTNGEFHIAPTKVAQLVYPVLQGFIRLGSFDDSDGGFNMNVMGNDMKKYLVGNKAYFNKLVENMEDANSPMSTLTNPMVAIVKSLLIKNGCID